MCSEGDHDDVADPHHPVLSAIHVHLGRSPEHGDGRHEAGEQRQRHRQHAHLSTSHEKFLRRLLLASTDAVEDADPEGNGQHEKEDGIIPAGEHRVRMEVCARSRPPPKAVNSSDCFEAVSSRPWNAPTAATAAVTLKR